MICRQCGHSNESSARFCSSCGTVLDGEDATANITAVSENPSGELAAVVEELPQGTAVFVVRRGPNAGSLFGLDRDEIAAGRHPAAGGPGFFDEDALAVARLASGFAKHGIQARHLRMYRAFAEREAVLYQQTLLALLRQRNPEARARAQEQLAELAKLGRGLRTAYLRQAARELLGE